MGVGLHGRDGGRGAKGEVGSPGILTGEDGNLIITGSKGEEGTIGLDGMDGLDGPPGETGSKGNKGDTGEIFIVIILTVILLYCNDYLYMINCIPLISCLMIIVIY